MEASQPIADLDALLEHRLPSGGGPFLALPGCACAPRQPRLRPPGDQEEDRASSDLMPEIHAEDLRGHLLAHEKSDLVDILLAPTLGDHRLVRRLPLETPRSRGQVVEGEALRTVIDDAVRHNGFVNWREAASYARSIEDVVDAIDGLRKAGKLEAVIELAEYALRRSKPSWIRSTIPTAASGPSWTGCGTSTTAPAEAPGRAGRHLRRGFSRESFIQSGTSSTTLLQLMPMCWGPRRWARTASSPRPNGRR